MAILSLGDLNQVGASSGCRDRVTVSWVEARDVAPCPAEPRVAWTLTPSVFKCSSPGPTFLFKPRVTFQMFLLSPASVLAHLNGKIPFF